MNETKNKRIQGVEQTEYFTNCWLSNYQTEGRLVAVNDKYLAISWMEAGLIKLVNSYEPQNLLKNESGFKLEDSNILDMEFSPFDNGILCFSNANNNVYIVKLEDNGEGVININSKPYIEHTKKINSVNFNPIVSHLMCSCTHNGDIHVWDSEKFKTHISFSVNDNPNSILWSPNGDLLGINTKKRLFNIYDARIPDIVHSSIISEKFSYPKFSWIDNNTVATIGWNNNNKKFLSLLDIRKSGETNCAISTEYIDNNISITTLFVNPELKIIYSIAKDEFPIKIYDYSSGKIVKNNEYKPTLGVNNFSIYFNRHYLNKGKSEIDRFARLTKNKNIQYVKFFLSPKEDFKGILYPSEESKSPQMTLKNWLSGELFEKIPKRLYKKKISNQFSNNNPEDSYLDSQENKSKPSNKQRKDSLNSQNKNLGRKNEFTNDRKSNYNFAENQYLKNNKNINTNQQSTNYEKLYIKLDQDYKKLSQDYNKMRKDLEDKNHIYQKCEVEKNFYIQEYNKYKSLFKIKSNDFQNLSFEIDKYKQNEKQFSDSISRLKSQIKEKKLLIEAKEQEIINSKNIINQKENTIKNNQTKILDLNEKIKKFSKEKTEYEQRISELNNFKKEFDQLKIERDNLNRNNIDLEQKNKLLKQNINESKSKYQEINNKYEYEQKKSQDLSKENEKLIANNNNFDDLQKENENNKKIINELNNKILKNEQIISNLEKNLDAVQKGSSELENRIKYLTKVDDENKTLKQNIKQFENEINKLKGEKISVNEELNKIKIDYENNQKKIGKLENENRNLKLKEQTQDNSMKELSKRLKQIENEKSDNKINEDK